MLLACVVPQLEAQPEISWPDLIVRKHYEGFAAPVQITHAGDNRIFVVELGGKIRLIKDGTIQSEPFLDVSGRISTGGERGLLGLAFPVDHAETGRFYLNYTNQSGATVIARYGITPNPDIGDFQSEEIVLEQPQPFSNHNGVRLPLVTTGTSTWDWEMAALPVIP